MKTCKRSAVVGWAILVLLVCPSWVQAGIADGLIGYWRLDETAGTLAADSSPSGNDGALLGFPANNDHWIAGGGRWGDGALDFGNREDTRLVVPSRVTISAQKGTISHWLKSAGLPTLIAYYFSDKGTGTYNGYGSIGKAGLEVHTGTNLNSASQWDFFIEHWSSGKQASNHIIGGTVSPGQWIHVVGTWQSGGQACLYVNGELAAQATISDITMNAAFEAIGGTLQDLKTTSGRNWAGLIDEVRTYDRALSATEVRELFGAKPPPLTLASAPNPAVGMTHVLRDSTLTWMAAESADKYDVYLGTNLSAVSSATAATTAVYRGRQAATSFAPGRLTLGQTYYWRVDVVASNGTVSKGLVWSFTVEPVGALLTGVPITATASSSDGATHGPGNTVNGSGLAEGMHSQEPNDMWLSAKESTGAWIAYAFDKPYKLHEMQVWNHNTALESLVGFGIKEAVIEYSQDGKAWTSLSTAQLARAALTTVALQDVVATAVRITAKSNWGGSSISMA